MTAAKLLDARMREVRGANRMAAVDRVEVLAALNFAHELQQLREHSERRDRERASTAGELQRKPDGLTSEDRSVGYRRVGTWRSGRSTSHSKTDTMSG